MFETIAVENSVIKLVFKQTLLVITSFQNIIFIYLEITEFPCLLKGNSVLSW